MLQFTVFVNNRKARNGKKVEVAIYGEAGVYVGLSAIDRSFYSMQAGNELTYARVTPQIITNRYMKKQLVIVLST